MLFNKSRAIEYMRRYELDVLVATSPVNITYFSDYYCWLDPLFKEYMMAPGASSDPSQAYAVFALEGEPALIVDPMFAVNAVDVWVRDLYAFGDPCLDGSLPPAGLPDALRRFYELLHALPRAAIKDCTSLIRLIRMVKSAEEIVRLTRAAQINEQAAIESLALARPGLPVTGLSRHYRSRAAESGADFDHFAFGMRGLGIGLEPDYVLADDDVLYVDFGCIYQHYFSDSGTTLAMREPLEHRAQPVQPAALKQNPS